MEKLRQSDLRHYLGGHINQEDNFNESALETGELQVSIDYKLTYCTFIDSQEHGLLDLSCFNLDSQTLNQLEKAQQEFLDQREFNFQIFDPRIDALDSASIIKDGQEFNQSLIEEMARSIGELWKKFPGIAQINEFVQMTGNGLNIKMSSLIRRFIQSQGKQTSQNSGLADYDNSKFQTHFPLAWKKIKLRFNSWSNLERVCLMVRQNKMTLNALKSQYKISIGQARTIKNFTLNDLQKHESHENKKRFGLSLVAQKLIMKFIKNGNTLIKPSSIQDYLKDKMNVKFKTQQV